MPTTKYPDTSHPRLPTWLTAALRRQAEHDNPCASARPPHQTAALLYGTEEDPLSRTHPEKR